jgi:predicted Zn-dependent peptidase
MPQFHHHQLPSGLTVVAEQNDDAHTSAVGFFVKTGTRDEDKPVMGVSHFLEHMMFKGTARRSADDVNREFDEIGANYNAYTSHEATVYYAQVLPEYLPRAIDLLGDMLRPALREEDFSMEKNVILEEISMYDDRPQWRLQDTLLERFFGDHPLSYRVLGTSDSIKALTASQMRDYFNQRYSPDNITVAAAGRIDFQKLIEDVSKITSQWSPTGVHRQYAAPTATPFSEKIVDPKVNRFYMAMMCPGPSAQDDRRYTAKIIADVLGDAEGSRLYWALIDPGFADEADFSFMPFDQTGSFFAFASCDPDRAGQVEETMMKTLDGYEESIEDAEIERAKNKVATQATLAGENPGGRMRGVGSQWLYQGEYRSLKEELDHIMRVTADDVRSLLREMPLGPRTIVRMGPK